MRITVLPACLGWCLLVGPPTSRLHRDCKEEPLGLYWSERQEPTCASHAPSVAREVWLMSSLSVEMWGEVPHVYVPGIIFQRPNVVTWFSPEHQDMFSALRAYLLVLSEICCYSETRAEKWVLVTTHCKIYAVKNASGGGSISDIFCSFC